MWLNWRVEGLAVCGECAIKGDLQSHVTMVRGGSTTYGAAAANQKLLYMHKGRTCGTRGQPITTGLASWHSWALMVSCIESTCSWPDYFRVF